jgi:hypothetical protein
MHPAGFEPAIPEKKGPKTLALGRSVTGTEVYFLDLLIYFFKSKQEL